MPLIEVKAVTLETLLRNLLEVFGPFGRAHSMVDSFILINLSQKSSACEGMQERAGKGFIFGR
jgi:hypothetical protein